MHIPGSPGPEWEPLRGSVVQQFKGTHYATLRPHMIAFYLHEMSGTDKSIESGSRCMVARGWGTGQWPATTAQGHG